MNKKLNIRRSKIQGIRSLLIPKIPYAVLILMVLASVFVLTLEGNFIHNLIIAILGLIGAKLGYIVNRNEGDQLYV